MYDRGDWDILGRLQRHATAHPAEAALGVLRLFSVLDGSRLTPLGSWAQAELQRVVPPQITPLMPARDLLAQLAGLDQVDAGNRADRWFGNRDIDQITTELAAAAAAATPAERLTAVDLIGGFGEDAVAAATAAGAPPTLAPICGHWRTNSDRHQRPAPRTWCGWPPSTPTPT